MQQELSPGALDEFLRVYAARRLRLTGRAPSPNTLRTKRTHVRAASRAMSVLEPDILGRLLADRDQLEVLLDRTAARMTPGAMRTVVHALISYGEYAKSQGWITDHAITRADVPPQNPVPAITVYSQTELEAFFQASKGRGLRFHAFLAFLIDSGRRVGEALALEWDWFRLDDYPPYIELPSTKTTPQYVPLTKRLTEEVFTPFLVRSLKGDVREGLRSWTRDPSVHPFPWTYPSVHNRFDYFCKVTGLPNRGFHNFRHTLITDRLARGVPMHVVSSLAGHSNINTTQRRYDHTTALSFARYVEREYLTGEDGDRKGA